MVIIGKPVNGISLNGNEYVLDEQEHTCIFQGKDEGRRFLYRHGISENDIEAMGIVFETLPEKEHEEGGRLCQQQNSFAPTGKKSKF